MPVRGIAIEIATSILMEDPDSTTALPLRLTYRFVHEPPVRTRPWLLGAEVALSCGQWHVEGLAYFEPTHIERFIGLSAGIEGTCDARLVLCDLDQYAATFFATHERCPDGVLVSGTWGFPTGVRRGLADDRVECPTNTTLAFQFQSAHLSWTQFDEVLHSLESVLLHAGLRR